MKVPNILMQFYLGVRKIPFVGDKIIAPILAFAWDRVISPGFDRLFARKKTKQDPLVSSYSSVISGLRIQVENIQSDIRNVGGAPLNEKIQSMEMEIYRLRDELNKLRWDMELRDSMESAALEGVLRAQANAAALKTVQ